MTSEISLVNKRGLVLAADSAVTIGGSKVMNNASKLFTLDSNHYIGMMIYGNADLGYVPWEVIIKSYREKLGNRTFNKLTEYGEDFVKYVSEIAWYGLTRNDDLIFYRYLNEILQTLSSDVEVYQENAEFEKVFENSLDIKYHVDNVISDKNMGYDYGKFKSENSEKISKSVLQRFNQKLSKSLLEKLNTTIFKLINNSNLFSNGNTGVVIAGYGKDEIFPTVIEYQMEGFFQNKLKYRTKNCIQISDLNGGTAGSTLPFAQSDMISTFMRGIDPWLEDQINMQTSGTINLIEEAGMKDTNEKEMVQSLVHKIYDSLEENIANNYQIPFNELVSLLSLQELATMGETLINLTSFRRKFSANIESVGGPVDVLVISRGEGPVWVKRKKYFDRELNDGYTLRRQ